MTEDFEAALAVRRWLVPLLAVATAAACTLAIAAYRAAAPIDHLHNYTGANGRAGRVSIEEYLFTFPAMLALGLLVVLDGPYVTSAYRRVSFGKVGQGVIGLIWVGVLFLGSIHRSLPMLHQHW